MEDRQVRDAMRKRVTDMIDILGKLLADINRLDGIETFIK